MVTKWKNNWLVLVWLLLFSHGVSGIMTGLLHGEDYFLKNYFQTRQFEGQMNHFIDTLFLFEINHLTPDDAKKLITVSTGEIEEYRNRYGTLPQQIENIKGQYEGKIQSALASKNQEIANAYIAERDKKLGDITQNFQSEDYVRTKIIKEKEQKIDEFYKKIESQRPDYLRLKNQFQYQLKDSQSGKMYTNINTWNPQDMAFIQTYPSAKYGPLSTQGQINEIDQLLPGRVATIVEGEIAVPKSLISQGATLDNYSEYQHQQKIFYVNLITGFVAFIASLYLYKKIPVLVTVAPQKWQHIYNRVPIDLRAGILAFSILLTFVTLTVNRIYQYDSVAEFLFNWALITLFITISLIQAKYFYTVVREGHFKSEIPKSLICRVLSGIKSTFLIRRIGTQILILLIIVFVFGAGLVIASNRVPFMFFYIVVFLVVGLPIFIYIMKWSGYLNHIIVHTSELSQGNLLPDIPVIGKSPLSTLASNINQLKSGVKTSQKEQAKSERLKTELITNVSHDLRTPLTSIISYTELLKASDLTDDKRTTYVEIIDRKSKRLKVLIDDLFEATKMASGNVELVKETVDLVQLLQQALAEYNEQINQSTLQFRVNAPETAVNAYVDGQKLWRVFDNLIGNILKYSLENTRVYITVKDTPNRALMIFKNVTKYELGENIDELFERFKRGDTSRHAEGSGLGLAIAKSIVDLHEGTLDIEVDGDLFKVTLMLNK